MAAAILLASGCKPKPKEISSLQRKEAAAAVSEAQFAENVRDFARAETLLVQATTACPDAGNYWLELGRVRVRAGNRGGAKEAYKSALSAFEDGSARNAKDSVAIFGQIYALASLGRADEARALLAKARKNLPDDRDLRAFDEGKQLDALLASPAFKEVAL